MAKAKFGSGWYTFADGYSCWSNGYSKNEMAWEVYHHGKLISYQPD